VPSAWVVVYEAEAAPWHSEQAMAARSVGATWAWWAPTVMAVVTELPERSVGGAALATPPWQEEQVMPPVSTTPFTWVAATTVVLV
jgi:hypothetical protein